MEVGLPEARAVAAAFGKEVSSVPRFELLQQAQLTGSALPEEEGLSADVCREAFLEKWKLRPPRFLRVIDCEATVETGEVVLIDWDITNSAPASTGFLQGEQQAGTNSHDQEPGVNTASRVAEQGADVVLMDWDITDAASAASGSGADEDDEAGTGNEEEPSDIASDVVSDADSDEDDDRDGYCALSHTYGMYVYEVFNCACASNCKAEVARADPEKTPCKGMHEDPQLQQSVISDILGMCQLLVQAGEVRYAWHDGVCIAQYNEGEVQHFIRHMGWIYANAQSTIIFLHYIGRPMAPIGPGISPFDLISRWQTRVWTFQEAALSRFRRYCVRTGPSLHKCSSLQEFEDALASWYEEGGDNSIQILDEEDFWDLVEDMLGVLTELPADCLRPDNPMTAFKVMKWVNCLTMWVWWLKSSCQSFPSIVHALDVCSSRESKHEGDRINSILALAGVQDFDAHKDDHVEKSTLEFFKRMQEGQGQSNRLALALFTTNKYASASERKHTWFPTLSTGLMLTSTHTSTREPTFDTEELDFKVLDDGSLEVIGRLACVAVRFNVVEGGAESSATHESIICEVESRCMNELVVDLVNDPYGSFRASVASTNSMNEPIEIGSALLPTLLEWHSGGEMKSGNSRDESWVKQTWPMVEEWLAAVPRDPQSAADRARLLALPALPEYELWPTPMVEAEPNCATSFAETTGCDQLMTLLPRSSGAGSSAAAKYTVKTPASTSFNAVIVFPSKALEQNFVSPVSSSHLHNNQASSISAFVVQGADPDHSKVARIGCFVGSPSLPAILRQDRYANTCTFRNKLVVK